ncbi:MAG TPA: hypothetical protein VE860_04565 [Chthoniobacterales bacterium]|nr:hypothetical protein [Chthoniobacterales bacterium]
MMNTIQKDQKPRAGHGADPLMSDSAVDLVKIAKPVGTFAGGTDFVLRFHGGEPIATDTGDQGGGQN